MIFFFSSRRRHTRYWRDWSSDVCSSDLIRAAGGRRRGQEGDGGGPGRLDPRRAEGRHEGPDDLRPRGRPGRSEERRVGKEWRCRGSPDHLKKKKKTIKLLCPLVLQANLS